MAVKFKEKFQSPLVSFFSLHTIWKLLVPLGVFIFVNTLQVGPNDFWWHLRTGQITLADGRIPPVDLFSFTRAGEPWINQAWLMQAALYLLYRAGDLPLVIFAHALTLATGYALLQQVATAGNNLRLAVLATAFGAVMGLWNWGIRPQSLSFLAFGLLIFLIESHRRGRERRIWWVLPLFVVWGNAHGAFVFGVAVLGLYVVGRLWEFWQAGRPELQRRSMVELSLAGLLTWGALALNPQGLAGLVRYVLGFVQSDATLEYNFEFQPITIQNGDGMLLVISVLLLFMIISRSNYRPRTDQILNLLLFTGLAMLARRNLVWYGFIWAPVAAAGLTAWAGRSQAMLPGKVRLNAAVLVLLALAALAALPWWRAQNPLAPPERRSYVSADTPVAASDFLCSTLPDDARVYQHQAFASYQIWACPELPVFMDTRLELYGSELWDDYFAVELGRFDWQEVLARHGVTHLFLSREQQEWITDAAEASPDWVELYRDEAAVIFEFRMQN